MKKKKVIESHVLLWMSPIQRDRFIVALAIVSYLLCGQLHSAINFVRQHAGQLRAGQLRELQL